MSQAISSATAALPLAPPLRALLAQRYADLVAHLRVSGVPYYDDAGVAERVQRLLLVSDFAHGVLRAQPHLLAPAGLYWLGSGGDPGARLLAGPGLPEERGAALAQLRQRRAREALRLIFRDVNALDSLEDTLADTSSLYAALLELALRHAERSLRARHGVLRDARGQAQRMVVLALGKLGGSELNFSSDVDLILAYPEEGSSDGARALEASEYCARLTREFVGLLSEVTADGQVARVDLRLRPYGSAGRPAWSFAAMEAYYQNEGRDWERYAWIKARPVAGDLVAGRQLLAQLRPFVYRRYLDYTAFAGLRAMKTLIDAEVARKDLAENLKLGPGGIREIEFSVQLEQLIRGGREPGLREPSLLRALAAAERRGFIAGERARLLRRAWTLLRHVENRVQMYVDAQTHALPAEPLARLRIAQGLDYADAAALDTALAAQRAVVSAAFAPILGGAAPASVPGQDALLALWRDMQSGSATPAELSACALDAEAGAALQALASSHAVRSMSESARAGLERLLPRVLHVARHSAAPQLALPRLLRLLHNIARRSAYLALLEEAPAALQRLASLCAERAFLAGRVLAQPLLLDDVLDPRIEQLPLKAADIATEIAHLLDALDERGPEQELERINEARASLAFRLGLAFADARADAQATARRLAALAEAVLNAVLRLAEGELIARHGRLPGPGLGFCVIGYGSLGGHELGFASDLDVAFVYDSARAAASSDGARPLEGAQWYQRLAQRVVHWLGTVTRAGQLYAIDARLRPDGSKSLLVQSMDAYAGYQQQRAWTWEHQALVRARVVCGDAQIGASFAQLRQHVLARPRVPARVAAEVSVMRERWRAERDRSDAERFDLKQGAGGLLDLEFLLQGLALAHAARVPLLTESTSTAALIGALENARALASASAATLRAAHGVLLQRALTCTLDDRPRLVAREPALMQHAAGVLRVAAACGFAFASLQPAPDSR